MSELKAILATPHPKMKNACDGAIEVYLKSEADKVIADLTDKLQKESALLKETREWLIESQKMHKRCADNAIKIIRHQKYKRCLAMAEWCNSEMGRETFACFRPRHTKEVWREEHKYWAKWRKIWFELAMKFKEAK